MKRMSWFTGLVLASTFLAIAGFPQPAAHAGDTIPPTGTIVINNNATNTNTPAVKLSLTWSDGIGSGVSRMRFSNDGSHWTVWEPPVAIRDYTLPGTDGYKTVRVQYLDKMMNRSDAFSDYIRLDTVPPTGGIVINSGALTTPGQLVTLGLTWSDGTGSGVTRMRFSDDGAHWTAWELSAANRPYTLPAGQGYHTVRVQYADATGNYSPVYSDYIKVQEPKQETWMLPNDVPLVMVWIPAGSFLMGTGGSEGAYAHEAPPHIVTQSGFWMGKYEVTKRQWIAVMVSQPWEGQPQVLSHFDSPAVDVWGGDMELFITRLNTLTGKTFRLPSEAQWEYACRAGTSTAYYWGEDPQHAMIGAYAWWNGNANSVGQRYAHVVGQKIPNAWGLYDMIGNVREWCDDDWHDTYEGAPTNGAQAWIDIPRNGLRLLRGGDWAEYVWNTRSASRYSSSWGVTSEFYGFRVVRTP